MSSLLFGIKAALVLFLLAVNTLFWFLPLLLLIPVKAAIPSAGWRNVCTLLMRRLAVRWAVAMNAIVDVFSPREWDVEIPAEVDGSKGWYLLICNHQSWVDILVLIRLFVERLPFPVFFAKKELRRLPLFGQAMWGLDFPFVERHSRQDVERRPELRGRDLQTARTACEKARQMPTTLIVYPEGTRFSAEKHRNQGSPFRHLLSPRPGGTAVVLTTLGDRLGGILDVTIAYPKGRPGLIEALVGRTGPVIVRARLLEIDPELKEGDYAGDTRLRNRHKEWLQGIWREKDELLSKLLSGR